jgi:hypothetical protein
VRPEDDEAPFATYATELAIFVKTRGGFSVTVLIPIDLEPDSDVWTSPVAPNDGSQGQQSSDAREPEEPTSEGEV